MDEMVIEDLSDLLEKRSVNAVQWLPYHMQINLLN